MLEWLKIKDEHHLRELLQDKDKLNFLHFYITNKNNPIKSIFFFRMFKYFQVEKNNEFKVSDIGEYVSEKINLIKAKEYRTMPKFELNLNYLLKFHKDIEKNLSQKNMYKSVRLLLMMCSDYDLKIVPKILIKQIRFPGKWLKIIKEEYENEKSI